MYFEKNSLNCTNPEGLHKLQKSWVPIETMDLTFYWKLRVKTGLYFLSLSLINNTSASASVPVPLLKLHFIVVPWVSQLCKLKLSIQTQNIHQDVRQYDIGETVVVDQSRVEQQRGYRKHPKAALTVQATNGCPQRRGALGRAIILRLQVSIGPANNIPNGQVRPELNPLIYELRPKPL